MKIIKEGDLQPRKFTCTTCGCVFIANRDEYQAVWLSPSQISIKCPHCNQDLIYFKTRVPLYTEESSKNKKKRFLWFGTET